MTNAHRPPTELAATSEPANRVIQRWRDLRSMLIQQLDMFEGGGLTLHSDQADVSVAAIADLKRNILEFDVLISEEDARPGPA